MTDPAGPRRIDAHHHVWDLAVRDQPWTASRPALRRSFGFADLRPELERHGVDGTVLVQTVCVPDETPELLELADATRGSTPAVAGVVGWLDLTAADVGEQLDALAAARGGDRLVGIRHQVQEEDDKGWLLRADVGRGLRAVAARGYVYDLLVRSDQLTSAVAVAAREPAVRFVLDHAGKPDLGPGGLTSWTSDVSELAKCANVVVKLSGLTSYPDRSWTLDRLRPVVDVLLDQLGPARLMFGSDWPVCELGGGYDAAIAATEELVSDLTLAERTSIFGGTAIHAYGLAR